MKTKLFLWVVICGGTFMTLADSSPLAISTNVLAFIDTSGSPYAVTSAVAGVSVTYRTGETVSAIAPDGTTQLLADAPSVSGRVKWMPVAGGVWTLTNSVFGVVTFSLRYSDFGTQGTGTANDPAKIMDDTELSDLVHAGTLSGGAWFSLRGPRLSMESLVRPAGHAVHVERDGLYSVWASANGEVFKGGAATSVLETVCLGPDRRIFAREALNIAYSGDGWIGDALAESTLTVVSPSASVEESSLDGCGAVTFRPDEYGVWTITLNTDKATLTSRVKVFPRQFSISFR